MKPCGHLGEDSRQSGEERTEAGSCFKSYSAGKEPNLAYYVFLFLLMYQGFLKNCLKLKTSNLPKELSPQPQKTGFGLAAKAPSGLKERLGTAKSRQMQRTPGEPREGPARPRSRHSRLLNSFPWQLAGEHHGACLACLATQHSNLLPRTTESPSV